MNETVETGLRNSGLSTNDLLSRLQADRKQIISLLYGRLIGQNVDFSPGPVGQSAVKRTVRKTWFAVL